MAKTGTFPAEPTAKIKTLYDYVDEESVIELTGRADQSLANLKVRFLMQYTLIIIIIIIDPKKEDNWFDKRPY